MTPVSIFLTQKNTRLFNKEKLKIITEVQLK